MQGNSKAGKCTHSPCLPTCAAVALVAPRAQHSLNQSVIHNHLLLLQLLLGILMLLLAAKLVQPGKHQRRRHRRYRLLLLGSARPPGGSRRWLAAWSPQDLHAARAAQQRRCLCCR
jgi:hypothetical protein